MKSDSSEARKTTAFAISIGTPRRPARFLTARFSGTVSWPTGEPIRLGEIELTRIPSDASCTAIERVKFKTPALAVVYAVASLRPQWPEVDAMLMILPLFF